MDVHNQVWDCVVIGGGVVGLNTAYCLCKKGLKTLVLEQFHMPHTRGSSHGQSRLIRKCHDNDFYTQLCGQAYNMWQDIQREGGKELMVQTGLLLLQRDRDGSDVERARELMSRHHMEHEWLSGDDIRTRYPMVRYSTDYKAVLDKTASVLLADACLQVLQKLVVKHGGVIQDGVQVSNIHPGQTVTIETNKGNVAARNVVIATGPWSKELLAKVNVDVPLKTMPGRVCYWRTKTPEQHHMGVLPSVLHNTYTGGTYSMMYAVPVLEYPGYVKNMPGLHAFWRASRIADHMPDRLPMLYDLKEPYYSDIPGSVGFVGLFPCVEYGGLVKTMPGMHCYWKNKNPGNNDFLPGSFPQWYEGMEDGQQYRFIMAFPSTDYQGLVKTMPGLHIFWKTNTTETHRPGPFPMFEESIKTRDGNRFFVAFPMVDYQGFIKVVSRGEPAPFYCHPDERDVRPMGHMVDVIAKYIGEHLPGVETKPSIIEPCMYCMTPDKKAIIDRHPQHSNIIIGTGFSGKGFMLAPVAGEMMCDLVRGDRPQWDMTEFSLSRFNQQPQQSKL